MMEKVINLIQEKNLTVPYILFSNYKELNINEHELILIIYLINEPNKIYNPIEIGKVLKQETGSVLELVNELTIKDLLTIDVKIENKIHTEYYSLDNLYKKLAFLVVNEELKEKVNNNIYDNFEKEIGRPLSPIEFELINGWQSNKISDELILLALKEAVYNGAVSLRYIDRILFDWTKKGIKTEADVMLEKKKFQKKKEKPDVFNYDWLNDEKTDKNK
ncbi:MAG: DnaD domain protein [Bacilli bacterium]|nr:DnaD domain protein [Bacilli bacterium]MDD4283250.1 DnaD domain protein [Bacilli bacterium]MDD4718389.1 DnaD domain protein [Bacilli bacterium]